MIYDNIYYLIYVVYACIYIYIYIYIHTYICCARQETDIRVAADKQRTSHRRRASPLASTRTGGRSSEKGEVLLRNTAHFFQVV